ncbi:hypothetical protein L5515_004075 [Caenorhabditis briggsae]|uniref:Protein CBR-EVL-14 n=1 Tax=Caenorhabditis briggsae TaxID=6238 RepID=A0AAE9JBX8_CAEBR|nr:hypothetical protein L5515_004075 [Caenorhabditis briggsae]
MDEDVYYPQGCLPIENTLNVSQQIERLRKLSICLLDCKTGVDADTEPPKRFTKLFKHLSQHCFLNNSNSDFRLYLSLCLGHILRIFQPEIPTPTAVYLKEVYLHIFRTLRGLSEITTDNPKFKNYFTLVGVIEKILNPLNEMRDEDEIEAITVIKCFFKGFLVLTSGKAWKKNLGAECQKLSKNEGPSDADPVTESDEDLDNDNRMSHGDQEMNDSIINKLVNIAKEILSSMEYVPNEIMDVILYQITSHQRTNFPEARMMAENVIKVCLEKENPSADENVLIRSIRNVITSAAKEGKLPEEFEKCGYDNRHKFFDLLRYLHYISEKLVAGATEELKFWLQSDNPQYRKDAVRTVGLCTKDKHCQFGMESDDSTWNAFLNASSDRDEKVRYEFVDQAKNILFSNHSHLRGQVINALFRLSKDLDDEVRLHVVEIVTDVAKSKLEVISDKLLKLCAERMRDKKPKVRNTSIKLFMDLFHHIMTSKPEPYCKGVNASSSNRIENAALRYTESDKNCVRFIPSAVLHVARIPHKFPAYTDSRLLIERYMQVYFIPYKSSASTRVKIMTSLHRDLDDLGRIMFADIITRSSQLRRAMLGILSQVGSSNEVTADSSAQIQTRISRIAQIFPEPAALERVMKGLVNQMALEEAIFADFKKLMDDRFTTKDNVEIALNMKSKIEKKLTGGKNAQTIFRHFLDRVIPLSFDSLAAKELINVVSETIAAKIDRKNWAETCFEKDLELLKLFSDQFAHAFADEETVELIRDKILEHDEAVSVEVALQCLSRIFENSKFRKTFNEESTRKARWYLLISKKLKEYVMREEPELRHSCKLATRLLASFLGKEKAVEFFDGEFATLVDRLHLENPAASNSFQVLAEISLIDVPHYFQRIMKIVESEKIGTMIMTSPDHDDEDPTLFDNLVHLEQQPWPKLTAAKVYAAKFTAKVLCAMLVLTDPDQKAEIATASQKFIDLLSEILEKNGDLGGQQCEAEKARLRVTAAGCLLKLASGITYRSKIRPHLFKRMAYMITDEAYCVRLYYAKHIRKGIGRRLPIEFAACYGLINLGLTEEDGENKMEAFKGICMNQAIQSFAERSEDRANAANLQGPQRAIFCAETVIAYVVWLLANYDGLEKIEKNADKGDSEEVLEQKAANVNVLAQLQESMWVVMDALKLAKCNMQKVWLVLEKLKSCGDKPMRSEKSLTSVELIEHNKKIWALCDLGISMMLYRAKLQMEDQDSKDVGFNLQFFYVCEKNTFDPSNCYAPDVLINSEKQRNGKLPKAGHIFQVADITVVAPQEERGNETSASNSSRNVSRRTGANTSGGKRKGVGRGGRRSGASVGSEDDEMKSPPQVKKTRSRRGVYDLPDEENEDEFIPPSKRRNARSSNRGGRDEEEEVDKMPDELIPPKRRGARTSNRNVPDKEEDEMPDELIPPKRRGGRSSARAVPNEEEEDEMPDELIPPKRRAGPSPKATSSVNGITSQNDVSPKKRSSGRGSRSNKKESEVESSSLEQDEERIDDVSLDNLVISPILNESSGRNRRSARTIAATATLTASTPLVNTKPKTVKRKRSEVLVEEQEEEEEEAPTPKNRTTGRNDPSTPRAKKASATVEKTNSVKTVSPVKKAATKETPKTPTRNSSRSSAKSSAKSPEKPPAKNSKTKVTSPKKNKYGMPMEEDDETPTTSAPSVKFRTSRRLSKK